MIFDVPPPNDGLTESTELSSCSQVATSDDGLIDPMIFDVSPPDDGLTKPMIFFDDEKVQSEPQLSDSDGSLDECTQADQKAETDLTDAICENAASKGEIESVQAEIYEQGTVPSETDQSQAVLNLYVDNRQLDVYMPPFPVQPIFSPAEDTKEEPEPEVEKDTVYKYAKEFMRRHHIVVVGEIIFVYNDRFYEQLPNRELRRMILEDFRQITAAGANSPFRRELIETLLDEPRLARKELAADPQVVTFQNGIVVLETGELLPHSPKWITTYCLQCDYLPGLPETPVFDRFLADITGGDKMLMARIWQMIGYVLSPDTRGKVLFLLQGVPNSGKSVLSDLLRLFFDNSALISLDIHSLSDKFAPATLCGKALCTSPDLPSSTLDDKAVSKLKQLTGGDNVTTDIKFGNHISFYNTATFVAGTNHALFPNKKDEAFFERIVVIPFRYSTPKEKRDRFLRERLRQELDAIATKAIKIAYPNLLRNNYQFAGDYQLNEVIDTEDRSADLSGSIYNFALTNFERAERSLVLTDDARRMVEEQFGMSVPSQSFTPIFRECVLQLFGAQETRTRNGYPNARRHIEGIRFKIDEQSNDVYNSRRNNNGTKEVS